MRWRLFLRVHEEFLHVAHITSDRFVVVVKMGARLILVGLVVLLPICQTFAQTCDQIKYTLINDVRRSTAYKTTTTRICDRGFIKDDEWYRFESVAGNTMPTKNPGIDVCGTYVPIWLQWRASHHRQCRGWQKSLRCSTIQFHQRDVVFPTTLRWLNVVHFISTVWRNPNSVTWLIAQVRSLVM